MSSAGDAIDRRSVAALLERAARDVPGWTPFDQLLALFGIAAGSASIGGDLLELGSWCGRSTVALGLAAKLTGRRVHCFDLFPAASDWYRNADGSWSLRVRLPEGDVDAYAEQTVWREAFERDIAPLYARHEGTLDVFRETLASFDLAAHVLPHRGTSALLGRECRGTRFGIAFIDGDHGYAAVRRDIDRIVPFLLPGAWLCLDDAFTSYEGVDRAIRDFMTSDASFGNGVQVTRKMFAVQKLA